MELERLGRALGEQSLAAQDNGAVERVVKSAGRVLQILELFDILRREALVSEVSDLLDLPQSSTSVLLRSLVVMGYLTFNPRTRAFGPTTRVALLGSWVNGPLLSDGPLMRLLHRVNARTGQAVVLAARNQNWAQYIHVVQALSAVRVFLVKGTRRPLVCSGTGLTLLADREDGEIKRIGTRFNAEAGEGVPRICLATLLERVAEVRTNGYAFNYNTITPGGGSIAVRLPRLENDEQFSIAIAGPTHMLRAKKDEYVLTLHEEISNHIAGNSANFEVASQPN